MTAIQRVQIDVSFTYPQTIYVAASSGGAVTDQVTIYSPVVGAAITIVDRNSGNPPVIYALATGSSTVGSLVTDSGGNVPGWVIEGSYTISAAAVGSFTGASVGWEAVRGDGVENIYPGAVTMSALSNASANQLVPVGAILDFAGSAAPANYFMANGGVLSQTTYSTLYGVIGNAYNTGGEGAGNFRLPNFADAGSIGPNTYAVGQSGGSLSHTHSVPGLGIPSLYIPALSVNPAYVPTTGVTVYGSLGVSGIAAIEPGNFVGRYNFFMSNVGWGGASNYYYSNDTTIYGGGAAYIINAVAVGGTAVGYSSGGTIAVDTYATTTVASGTAAGTTGGSTTGGNSAVEPFVVVNKIIKYQ
jgi:microcystin-dependent protein